ncbi:MAG: dynamin family protein [Intestinibacter sp.]|uniref:dynamin family protein n=1 Tax=Intestinibacter sp. TaxID=1965304 RepID=UPI002A81211F|nr:dynamin family protein [Intestinibacter sp.]MDY4573504.1 dynamin family protein [Intestinibacter sp.]
MFNINDRKFDNINKNLYKICNNLDKNIINYDITPLKQIKNNFKLKIDEFYREDRKLNIGIIGQVKVGKSSFLNTVIFNGKEILPKAATPKTATLTKIEYSDENYIEIEYYTESEWKIIERDAKVDSNLNQYMVSKEIINMVKNNNIDPYTYIKNKNEKIKFDSYEDLIGELNTYIGEDGKLTPLVKSVKLYMNKEELKEISIVDTPGLNDPIISRTDKTKQFIEMCDVVFFLSKSVPFLEAHEMELLTSQLPQKGVQRIVLIASQQDSAIIDTLWDCDTLEEAYIDVQKRLKKRAKDEFNKIIDRYKTAVNKENIIKILQECKEPVIVSSMTYNMSKKQIENYNEEEQNVYENLNYTDEIDNDWLNKIGNIDEVKAIFEEVVEEKEKTLIQKANTFIPNVKNELKIELNNILDTVNKRINLLSDNDKNELENKKKSMQHQINDIKAELEGIFGDLNITMEKNRLEGVGELREISREYSNISEKTGTITHVETYRVSTSVWYKPSTWGTSRPESYCYEEQYYYLDASDALENIRNFANESITTIEKTFDKAVNLSDLKRRLLNIVVDQFDTADENYDAGYFKMLAQKTINDINFPIIKIDVQDYLNEISSKFSGEVTNSSDKSNLKMILGNTISKLLDVITDKFSDEVQSMKANLNNIKASFVDNLLKNIEDEFNIILQQCENKEAEIKNNKEFVKLVEGILNDEMLKNL